MKYFDRFRVPPSSKVKLADIDPGFKDHHHSHKEATEEIEHHEHRLRRLQDQFYADGRRSLLICLQGMDTGGKDGTINHVLGAMDPQGCRVKSFDNPRKRSLPTTSCGGSTGRPGRGIVTIFNRSHYEDVLVVRVHNVVPRAVWSRRYDQINAFEQNLVDNNTHILKFYLHISKQEQLTRFEERLDDPTKQWKISEADYKERKFWDDYMAAYEDVLSRCSTPHAPWFVIPSDHKWFRNLAIARIVVEYLEGLDMKYPEPSVDLEHIRREYHAAKEVQSLMTTTTDAVTTDTTGVAVFDRHRDAEAALRSLQDAGFDMRKLSIIGRDFYEDHAVGFYNTGHRVRHWGKLGAFWGTVFGIVLAPACFWIPGIGPILTGGIIGSLLMGAVEGGAVGAALGGGTGAVGAALADLGVHKDCVARFEADLKANRFLIITSGTSAEVERARAILAGRVDDASGIGAKIQPLRPRTSKSSTRRSRRTTCFAQRPRCPRSAHTSWSLGFEPHCGLMVGSQRRPST